jgi:hypothetical protein
MTFAGLTVAQLEQLQTDFLACLSAIANAHQSYSIGGRQFTRADLKEVRQTLSDIGSALEIKKKTLQRFIVSDLSNG